MPPRAAGRTARAGRGGVTTRGARGGARARGGAATATNPESEEQENATAENSEPRLAIQPAAVMELDTPSPIDTVGPLPSASSSRGTSTRAGKFRPKGVRRSEAEREKIVQEQDAILNKRLADDARQRARANRMRSRGAGRGGTRGRGGLISAMAAGPFSQGGGFGSTSGGYGVATSYRNTPEGRGTGGGGGGGRGDSKVKGGQAGDDDYATSYQEFDPRINADLLYSRSDYDGNNENSRSMPMGIPRVEHKEEGVVMATAAEIEAREHGAAADDESESEGEMWLGADLDKSKSEPLKDEEVWEHAAPTAGGPVRVKTADGTIIETMDIDEIAAGEVLKAETKPESKSDVKPTRKQRKRTIPQDPEDEYLAGVLERNLKVFGPQDDEAQAKGEPHPREGKVFLFQLPPILPPLVAKQMEPPVDLVKDEPNDDVIMLDVPHGDSARVDLTADDNKDTKDVKDEREMDEDEENTAQGRLRAGRAWPAAGGYLGKLVVRKSGKITLDWGGLPLAVEAAIPVNFIRTAVLIDHNDTKPDGEEPQQFQGTAYGMGRIEEKFCCAPIFTEPDPWIIDPEELKAPGEK